MTPPIVWYWLEDETGSVADFKPAIESAFPLRIFTRIPDLTRALLAEQGAIISGDSRIGLILDVMIAGARAITRPVGWFGATAEKTIWTSDGYDAGLTFFERLVLPDGEGVGFPKPPAVLLLTVMEAGKPDLDERFSRAKERWRVANYGEEGHGNVRVEWRCKWTAKADEVVATLTALAC